MKGVICKGESLRFEFDANQIIYNGRTLTTVKIPQSKISKAELVKLRNHGVIDTWMTMFEFFNIDVNTKEIEWED